MKRIILRPIRILSDFCFKSQTVYDYFKETLKFYLPFAATVLSWNPFSFINQGITNIIKNRIDQLQDKLAVLVFDEMPIQKTFSNNDKNDGLIKPVIKRNLRLLRKQGSSC